MPRLLPILFPVSLAVSDDHNFILLWDWLTLASTYKWCTWQLYISAWLARMSSGLICMSTNDRILFFIRQNNVPRHMHPYFFFIFYFLVSGFLRWSCHLSVVSTVWKRECRSSSAHCFCFLCVCPGWGVLRQIAVLFPGFLFLRILPIISCNGWICCALGGIRLHFI